MYVFTITKNDGKYNSCTLMTQEDHKQYLNKVE